MGTNEQLRCNTNTIAVFVLGAVIGGGRDSLCPGESEVLPAEEKAGRFQEGHEEYWGKYNIIVTITTASMG